MQFVKYSLAGFLLLAGLPGCSDGIGENQYREIQAGMNERAIVGRLGKPDETQTTGVAGGEHRKLTWRGDTHILVITLENDRLKYKTYRKNR